MVNENIKVLTSKVGTDDHTVGIVMVTESLRDAGMEVVYLGTGQRIEGVIQTAVQEDVDVIGLSFLNGGHVETMRRFMSRMKEHGLGHVLVIVGGTIPNHDIPRLKELGVGEVFLSGIPAKDIVSYISGKVKKKAKTG